MQSIKNPSLFPWKITDCDLEGSTARQPVWGSDMRPSSSPPASPSSQLELCVLSFPDGEDFPPQRARDMEKVLEVLAKGSGV